MGADENRLALADRLRTWRSKAGEQMSRGRPLSQVEVAKRCKMSDRWYRMLEAGQKVRLDEDVLSRLADALLLDQEQRAVLRLLTTRLSATVPCKHEVDDTSLQGLRLLLESFSPSPAFLTNETWDVLGYNRALADWFPFVVKENANFALWLLRSQEARQVFGADWREQARILLGGFRYHQLSHPGHARLDQIVALALQDQECRRLWEQNDDVARALVTSPIRLHLPGQGFRPVDVVVHVLQSAAMPTLFVAVLMILPNAY
jgi:transcriptional regulator with XRE-family HTH domain